MASILFREMKFIYSDSKGERLLLDCQDFLSNKSSVSMHRAQEQKIQTIPELLTGLWKREQTEMGKAAFPAVLLNILLTARLIRSRRPKRVLEYGSGNGRLSYHLATILGTFHEENLLVCAYDAMEPDWEAQMARVEKLPRLGYYAGDFGDMRLEEHSFDVVVVNGRVNFERPDLVLQDALRLAAEDGAVFVLTDDTPFLESAFKLLFETREEYEISPVSKVLTADVSKLVS